MSILQEIQKWSVGQPPWQQDAIARLYASRVLSAADMEEIYGFLRAAHGIEVVGLSPLIILEAAQVVAPVVANRVVQLTAIKNVSNVNALAQGQRLPIAPTGMTAIFGENGTGKSGYSRVLKQACRARDRHEVILPNARIPPPKGTPTTASFDIKVDGLDMEVEWTMGGSSPEQLSEIAIFDAHCARAYVDNEGDFAYSPYGLDILEGLAKLCGELSKRATMDMTRAVPDTKPFAALAQTRTEAGALAASLSATTPLADIEKLATVSSTEVERFEALTKSLAEADPRQKARDLRLRASAISELTARITSAAVALSQEQIQELRSLIERQRVAKAAADAARTQFSEVPGVLPGTGGEAWKELFEKARAFAAESHAGHFPPLNASDLCPLCQNPLTIDGQSRLVAFDSFVQAEAEKSYQAARSDAKAKYRLIDQADLDLKIAGAAAAALAGDVAFLENCHSFQTALMARRAAIVKAAGDESWDAVPAFPDSPAGALTQVFTTVTAQAKAMEESLDEAARAALIQERAELDARLRLAELKSTMLACVANFTLTARLQNCVNAASTTAISRKSTDLSKTMATQEVADALNKELSELYVQELQVTMKPASSAGKTQFKLTLQHSGGSPSAILSEGEQRAIAIASFLAEVRLGQGRGGIVFDDPVSSLDHRRRWHVARRLLEESAVRQVLIFTHDIYFLCILQQMAQKKGAEFTAQCIRRTALGYGVQSERLPFDALSTAKRIGVLKQRQQGIAALHRARNYEEAEADTLNVYGLLRMAWERAVEELLFQDVIMRFGEGVSTQRLKLVTVEPGDYHAVDEGMTKCSKFSGHDAAPAAQLPIPTPEELLQDIQKLDYWKTALEGRAKKLKADRI
ncbi:MAG: AAA family ATPase [Pseudomonadota bacterium]